MKSGLFSSCIFLNIAVQFSTPAKINQVANKNDDTASEYIWFNPAPISEKRKSSEETTEVNNVYEDVFVRTPHAKIKKHKQNELVRRKKRNHGKKKGNINEITKNISHNKKRVYPKLKQYNKKRNRILNCKGLHSRNKIGTPRTSLNFTHSDKLRHKGLPVDITVHIKMNDLNDEE